MRRSDLDAIRRWVQLQLMTAALAILALAAALGLILSRHVNDQGAVVPNLSIPLGPGVAIIGPLAAAQGSGPIPINQGLQGYGEPPGTGGTAYGIPDPTSRPHSPIELERIYLPVSIAPNSTSGDTPPTTALLQLTLVMANRIFWAWSQQFSLIQDQDFLSSASANYTLAEDLVNPIAIDEAENPQLYATLTVDQATTESFVVVGAQVANPTASPYQFNSMFGTAYYTIPGS